MAAAGRNGNAWSVLLMFTMIAALAGIIMIIILAGGAAILH